ncbi:MAG: benzoyl-CoA reductase, bzd-type, subunit Q [Deltaproteobacteria bacterium]|nr:benzoyl-CoA reductase, bzd-type, subunit Q [Deltaproteobacteria bacterium]
MQKHWGQEVLTKEEWGGASIITAGLDIGASSSEALIMVDNEIFSYSEMPTGGTSAEASQRVMNAALEGTGMRLEDIRYVVSTGYGRLMVPFSHKTVSEISCHARGAHWLFPNARTILDVGGQDCKSIRCNQKGKITQFLMSDKCAAGSGRSLEVIAELVSVPLEDVGMKSLEIEKEPPRVSSSCVVFAKSESLTLLRRGVSANEILAASCDALAHTLATLIQRVGLAEDLIMTGGVTKNIGVAKRVEKLLGVKVHTCQESAGVGALGASLFARDFLAKEGR